MSDKKIYDTLLQNLQENDYSALIKEEELIEQGYVIHYILDPSTLRHSYVFPQKETPQFIKTPDFIADEQLTLHHYLNVLKESLKNDIENPKNLQRVIMINEFYYELKQLVDLAKEETSNQSRALNNIIDENNELTNALLESTDIADQVKKNLSKAIAKILFQEKRIKSLRDLIQNCFIFDAEELDDFLGEAFTTTAEDDLDEKTRKLYQQFLKIDHSVKWKDNRSEKAYQASKWQDARTIARIYAINDYVQTNGNDKQKKHIFVLLTDARNSTRIMADNKNIFYLQDGNRTFIPCRTTPQLFAQLITTVYDGTKRNKEDTTKNLGDLKQKSEEIRKDFEDKKIQANNIQTESDGLYYRYRMLRNTYENMGIYRHFDDFYKNLETEIDNSNIKKFFEKVKTDAENLKKELEKQSNRLDLLLHEQQFNTAFRVGLDLLENGGGFFVKKGNDAVSGRFQHLPLGFNYAAFSGSHQTVLKAIIGFILSPDTPTLKTGLNTYLSNHDDKTIYPREEAIVKTLLLLILPQETTKNDYEDNNLVAYKWLKNFKNLDYFEGETYQKLKIEMLYVLCWAARRANKLTEAIELANEGLRLTNKKDPRFFHGRFLAQYAQCDSKQNQIEYQNIILDAKKSLDIKADFIDSEVKKQLEYSSHYSLAYFYTQLWKVLGNNSQDLVIARQHLTEIKNSLVKDSENRLPEYLIVEARLELEEAKVFKYNNDPKNAKFWLKEARKACKKAIERAGIAINSRQYDYTSLVKEKYVPLLSELETTTQKLGI